ncbi:hypothetical protein GQX74_015656 [Glossina fuscipes]|nr:hypothetical protein GQX74_015656 [Glossina fuscipes]
MQEVPFYFTLTPQQATEIASNRDIRSSSKVEHAIQVQLRFCLLETSCDQDDCFPPSVAVKVNNKMCQLPNALPQTRSNMEPKRPPRPINVTSNVKLSPTVTNTITVQWSPDYTRGYCIAVPIMISIDIEMLCRQIERHGLFVCVMHVGEMFNFLMTAVIGVPSSPSEGPRLIFPYQTPNKNLVIICNT